MHAKASGEHVTASILQRSDTVRTCLSTASTVVLSQADLDRQDAAAYRDTMHKLLDAKRKEDCPEVSSDSEGDLIDPSDPPENFNSDNDSDFGSGEGPKRTTSRRTQALPPVDTVVDAVDEKKPLLRQLSLKVKPSEEVMRSRSMLMPSTLTAAGRDAIRILRLKYAARQWAKVKTREVFSKKQFDTDAEDRFNRRLLKSFDIVKSCCGSMEKVVERRQQGIDSSMLANVEAFLRARLDFDEGHAFDKRMRKKALLDVRRSGLPFTLNGCVLCDNCFCAALGISASTLRRSSSTPVILSNDQTVRPLSMMRRAAHLLMSFVLQRGQSKPTGDGATHKYNLTLSLPTMESIRTALCEQADYMQLKDLKDISLSTLSRAKKWLLSTMDMQLSFGKSKDFAKCTKCIMYANTLEKAKRAMNIDEISDTQFAYSEHTAEWMEQRQLFWMHKKRANKEPHYQWTATSDGMDQRKTHIPHINVESKHGAVQNVLPLRVVGSFIFGAPVPLVCMVSFDDVRSKGAMASITSLQETLNTQWLAMDETNVRPILAMRGDSGQQQLSAAEAQRLSESARAHPPQYDPEWKALVEPARRAAAAATAAAVAEATHAVVVEDEAKDGYVDMTSASSPPESATPAVAEAIHAVVVEDEEKDGDVDMTSAPPPPESAKPAGTEDTQKMRHASPTQQVPFVWPEGFHFTFDNTSADNKNSQTFNFLAVLVALGVFMWISASCLLVGHTHDIVDQMFSVWSRALGLRDAANLSALKEIFRSHYGSKIYEVEKKVKEFKRRRSRSATSDEEPLPSEEDIEPYLVELAEKLGVEVAIIRQEFTIEQSWLPGDDIPKLSQAHIFLLVKEDIDPADMAWARARLKRKFPEDKFPDPKRRDPGTEGVYLYSRHLAMSHLAPDVNNDPKCNDKVFGPYTARKLIMLVKEVPTTDPLRQPPQPIDTKPVRDCVNQLLNQKSIEPHQAEEMWRLLEDFERAQQSAAAHCAQCEQLQKAIADCGSLHRPEPHAPQAERDKYNAAVRDKEQKRQALTNHLKEPHDHLIQHGWWKKWIERVILYIQPYYKARGLIVDKDRQRQSGRTPHPDLPRQPNSMYPLKLRHDVEQLISQGPPPIGSMVLMRGAHHDVQHGFAPVWVGQIVLDPKLAAAAAAADVSASPPESSVDAAVEDESNADMDVDASATSSNARSSKRKRAQLAANAGSTKAKDTAKAPPVKKTRGVNARACVDDAADADPAEEVILSEESEEDEYTIGPKSKGKSKGKCKAAASKSKKAAAAAAASSTKSKKSKGLSAADARIQQEIAASIVAAGAERAQEAAKNQPVFVQWWQFVDTASVTVDMVDRALQSQWLVDHPIEGDDASASARELALWDRAMNPAASAEEFQRLPRRVVERWRGAQFTIAKSYPPEPLDCSTVIHWAMPKDMFTQRMSLQKAKFDIMLADVSEHKDTHPDEQ